MYGDDDPWLSIFLSPEVGGRVEAVEGDGWPFSQVDWDNRSHNNNSVYVSQFVIQFEFDLGSPVVAAAQMRQELLDIASDPWFGAPDKFSQALVNTAWLKALMQDDFDDEVELFEQLRERAVQNAASAAGTISSLYAGSVGVISEGAEIIITIGDLVEGEIGVAGAALTALPFVSRPMVDAGAKAIVRTETGQAIFKRGQDVPGLDKRAIQGIDSGQHGMGLIPRKDFAVSQVWEGMSVNGKTRLLVGTPQLIDGPEGPLHAAMVETLARARYEGPDAEYTVMNRSLKTATGRTDLGSQANLRPDVVVVNRNGKVDLIEVKSASQTPAELMDKLKDMRNALPTDNQGTVFVHDLNGDILGQFPLPSP